MLEPPRMVCVARKLPGLTADASSEFWRTIEPAELREAVTGGMPEQPTALGLAWDADELRVLFHSSDRDPWATLTARDAPLYTEEVVEVFLDPVGDLQSYFEIEVNPLNAVLDLVLRKNRSGYAKSLAWQCEGLRTRVSKSASEWTAELSIPFRSLIAGPPPAAGATWRANFCRIDRPRSGPRELSAWSPPGRPNFHTPERFGFVEFRAA